MSMVSGSTEIFYGDTQGCPDAGADGYSGRNESGMDSANARSTTTCFPRGVVYLVVATLVAFLNQGCSEKVAENFLGSGTLEARQVRVGALVSGKLLRLAFDEGDVVETGDTLAVIDVETLELQKEQTEARFDEIEASREAALQEIVRAEENLRSIEKSYRRISELFSSGSATRQQMDDVSSRLAVAKSSLKSAMSRLKTLEARRKELEASVRLLDRRIKEGDVVSPISGIVEQRFFEEGEIVAVGVPIYRIVDMSEFWLRVFIPESLLGAVIQGDTVEVRVDGIQEPLRGVISRVSQEAEFTPKNVQTRDARAELVYALKVRIIGGNRFLKIGMPAEVYSL